MRTAVGFINFEGARVPTLVVLVILRPGSLRSMYTTKHDLALFRIEVRNTLLLK